MTHHFKAPPDHIYCDVINASNYSCFHLAELQSINVTLQRFATEKVRGGAALKPRTACERTSIIFTTCLTFAPRITRASS